MDGRGQWAGRTVDSVAVRKILPGEALEFCFDLGCMIRCVVGMAVSLRIFSVHSFTEGIRLLMGPVLIADAQKVWVIHHKGMVE